jgi:hypothetical protein
MNKLLKNITVALITKKWHREKETEKPYEME